MEESLKKLEDTSQSSSDIANSWNSAHETLLASIGDKANCMRWMHTQSQIYYDRWNFWLSIPSVTLTALAGASTIGVTQVNPNAQTYITILIGVVTISTGVLTSINQLIKAPQSSEGHRIASIAYGKLYRVISNELALRRDQRTNAQEFLKVIRVEQDRLEESCPVIHANIIRRFNKKVESNATLEKPEIVGELDHIHVNMSSKPPPPGIARQVSDQPPASPVLRTKKQFPHNPLTNPISPNQRTSSPLSAPPPPSSLAVIPDH
uniref:SMODS and SLOG-associating 2TM effector domain-containing protein n=1 Tax=viral metagenome TaxID=1070528 RepID=A0A6C0AIL2_9ZZZZ